MIHIEIEALQCNHVEMNKRLHAKLLILIYYYHFIYLYIKLKTTPHGSNLQSVSRTFPHIPTSDSQRRITREFVFQIV